MGWVKRRTDGSYPPPNQRTLARRERFAHEYLMDLNATQAAVRAGYKPQWAAQVGHDLLVTPEVQALVKSAQARHAAQAQATADELVEELTKIIRADPRELVEHHRTNCPDCWLGLIPDDHAPDPECPRCLGKGIGHVYFADTRNLGPQAVALLASIEVTKDGMRYRFHSKLDALEKLARRLGMYEVDNAQRNQPLAEFVKYLLDNATGLPIKRAPPALPGPQAAP